MSKLIAGSVTLTFPILNERTGREADKMRAGQRNDFW